MKKLIKAISFSISISVLSITSLAATAHLEGEEEEIKESIFDKLGIDSNYLMANWYKIVIGTVIVGCIIGIIVTNIRYFIGKNKK